MHSDCCYGERFRSLDFVSYIKKACAMESFAEIDLVILHSESLETSRSWLLLFGSFVLDDTVDLDLSRDYRYRYST